MKRIGSRGSGQRGAVAVEGGGSVCTADTVGRNVTVSWTQDFGMGVMSNLIPIIPDSITREISGTFRCE